jgi:hypothetical protein
MKKRTTYLYMQAGSATWEKLFQPSPFFQAGEGAGKLKFLVTSVADPDPRVFGPPGSGSISQRYGSGSGSGSFYH